MDDRKAVKLGDLDRLHGLVNGATQRRSAPVESWDPPYCGDIGLKIGRDGIWYYRGSPFTRPALVKLFASVLRRDADGRTFLVTPTEKVDVEVEDAPFLAVEMEARGTGRSQSISFRTNVDDVVTCGAEHPMRIDLQQPGGGLKPYVLVRGRLEALLTRALLHDLVALAVEELLQGAPVPGVWSEGTFFPFVADAALSAP
ncbi:MAG: DUF1285 domain-containing protein [Hyphomicrobium sp.]|jgi:hypothetical protein